MVTAILNNLHWNSPICYSVLQQHLHASPLSLQLHIWSRDWWNRQCRPWQPLHINGAYKTSVRKPARETCCLRAIGMIILKLNLQQYVWGCGLDSRVSRQIIINFQDSWDVAKYVDYMSDCNFLWCKFLLNVCMLSWGTVINWYLRKLACKNFLLNL